MFFNGLFHESGKTPQLQKQIQQQPQSCVASDAAREEQQQQQRQHGCSKAHLEHVKQQRSQQTCL